MMNNIKIECMSVNCKSRKLSPEFQEYFDKMYGKPCTDMYDFEPLSKEECNEKGVQWGVKPKKKENITEDQQIKRIREEYQKYIGVDINTDINIDETIIHNLVADLQKSVNNAIKEKLNITNDDFINFKETTDYSSYKELKKWQKRIEKDKKG